jgi:hypothetical protein
MASSKSRIIYLLFFIGVQALCQQNSKLAYSEGLAPVPHDKRGKTSYGFVNEKGEFVIKPQFDSVQAGFRNGYAVVYKNEGAGLIDKSGKTIIPFNFTEIQSPVRNLIPVKNEEGLWGFFSADGRKITDCAYNNFRFRDKGRILVQRNGYWGVIDEQGKNIVNFEFRELEISEDNKALKVSRYNEWELKGADNKIRNKLSFDSLAPAGKGVLKYFMLGKFGLVDLQNNIIAHYKYDSLGTEQYGRFVVKVWDKYGAIDKTGQEVIPPRYEKIIIDSLDYRFAVKSKEGTLWWGMLDLNGNEVLPASMPFLGEGGADLIPAKAENGLWRYIDEKGQTVIPFRFTYAGPFRNGVAEVKDYLSDSLVVIDHSGKVVVKSSEYPFYKASLVWLDRDNRKIWSISRDNYEELYLLDKNFIRVRRKGKYGLLTIGDQLIIPCNYDYVSEPSSDGHVIVTQGKKWGVADSKTGRVSLAPTERFEKIFPFYEGFAKMMMKGKYGFIDPRGNVYISPQYPDAGHVSDGMVSVKINNKWGYVNTDEKLIVQPYYDLALPFHKGTAVTYSRNQYNLINKDGKELHEPLDNIKPTASGKYLLIQKGKYGLADAAGKEILPVKYDLIKEVEGGYLIVNLRGLYGVLDIGNNIVIPINYNYIHYDRFNKIFLCGSEKGYEHLDLRAEGR